jgi:hypothetical protein
MTHGYKALCKWSDIMHVDIDYTNRSTAAFDAVEDIKEYLGQKKFDEISPEFAKVTDCKQFRFYCMLGGIRGFPVKAWYESFHGQGSWKEPTDD